MDVPPPVLPRVRLQQVRHRERHDVVLPCAGTPSSGNGKAVEKSPQAQLWLSQKRHWVTFSEIAFLYYVGRAQRARTLALDDLAERARREDLNSTERSLSTVLTGTAIGTLKSI